MLRLLRLLAAPQTGCWACTCCRSSRAGGDRRTCCTRWRRQVGGRWFSVWVGCAPVCWRMMAWLQLLLQQIL